MNKPFLPPNIQSVDAGEQFAFACHSKISCFTECCRLLDLALTPYDILRLKNCLGLNSTDFLERYVIIEQDDDEPLPRLYLTMIDDGNASCVFVTNTGCSVYEDRPGACRAYPMGRAVKRGENNQMEQFFVLLHEDHCKGVEEILLQTPLQYSTDQGLDRYNEINDALVHIFQHDKLRQGMRLTQEQREFFILALYDLDRFHQELLAGKILEEPITEKRKRELEDDEKLLLFAANWLDRKLFQSL